MFSWVLSQYERDVNTYYYTLGVQGTRIMDLTRSGFQSMTTTGLPHEVLHHPLRPIHYLRLQKSIRRGLITGSLDLLYPTLG